MKYAIIKEGFNRDGSYSLFIEQEFESKEDGMVWQTPICMIYSTVSDEYDSMSDEYKKDVSKEDHDKENQERISDHSNKIAMLTNGSEKQREEIIQDLLIQHRVALKQSGHLDEDHKTHLKTLSEEEVRAELEAMPKDAEIVKVKQYKILQEKN